MKVGDLIEAVFESNQNIFFISYRFTVAPPRAVGQQEGRVRHAALELVDLERRPVALDMARHVAVERRLVETMRRQHRNGFEGGGDGRGLGHFSVIEWVCRLLSQVAGGLANGGIPPAAIFLRLQPRNAYTYIKEIEDAS